MVGLFGGHSADLGLAGDFSGPYEWILRRSAPGEIIELETLLYEAMRQDEILASPLVRAVWHTLSERAQELTLNPDLKLGDGRRYPLSSGELSELTGLSVRQIQYGSERGLVPHWLDEKGHRRFEAAGTILAFSIADTEQAERQHLTKILNADEPLTEMRKAIGRISLYALNAQPQASAEDLKETQAHLLLLADALAA